MSPLLLHSMGTMLTVGIALAVPAAQTQEAPVFEVAALHLRAEPAMAGVSPYGTGRWSANSLTLWHLLYRSFDLRPVVQPIVGLPEWASHEWYSIAVKAEEGVVLTSDALRPRLRRFIEERFKLVSHIETRRVKGYALVVASGGPKLNAITDPPTYDPDLMGKSQVSSTRLRSWSVNMDALAGALELLLNRGTRDGLPVVNETGLTGLFDLTLTFAPMQLQPGAAPVETDSSSPSLFTALQEQLGLRLVSRDGIPVDTLVVDHVEHPTVD